jgi:hypothetical protein
VTIRERGGAYIVTYKPGGHPTAEPEKTRLTCDAIDVSNRLLEIVIRHVDDGRRRLIEYRQRG